jgi:S-layer homology domain
VSWLASTGITNGYPDGEFKPTRAVTRGAMAAFLYRFNAARGVPLFQPPANPGNTKNCSDFSTWSSAQSWYERYYPYYGDIAQLDGNNDGLACTSLPGAP